jgi:hypothetical protein
MAGDDTHLGGFQLTSAFRICLAAAVDHLHAVTALVVQHGMLHIAAPGSLARGILENAAAAFWLIHPLRRNDRISHALRWWAKDARDRQAAFGAGSSADATLSRLKRLADLRGIDPGLVVKGYTSTEVVQYAEQHISSNEAHDMRFLLPWRLCSGYAHGRPWAYLGASEKTPPEQAMPQAGLGEVRITNALDAALFPALAGFVLLQAALRVHVTRASAQPPLQRP